MKVNLDKFCDGRVYRIEEIAYKLGISEMEASILLCKSANDYDIEVNYYGDAGFFYEINKK